MQGRANMAFFLRQVVLGSRWRLSEIMELGRTLCEVTSGMRFVCLVLWMMSPGVHPRMRIQSRDN